MKRPRLSIEDCRRGGRVSSPRKAAAVRVAAWRHGLRAKTVTHREVIVETLRQIDPNVHDLIEALVRQKLPDADEEQRREAVEFVEAAVVRRIQLSKLLREGLLVQKQGKLLANPRLELFTRGTKQGPTSRRRRRRDGDTDPGRDDDGG